jgi:PAS domain S-box-containing protein
MKSEKKFSRFIAWALILFEGVSLTLVLGILYGILSKTMTREHYNKIQAQQAEVDMILKDRLNQLETKLLELSLNNTVRVSLMLGVKSQLLEVMKEQYAPSNGAFLCVEEKVQGSFFPELPESLWPLRPHLQKLSSTGHLQAIRFGNFGDGLFLSILSNPIKRKNDHLGTAFALYDLSEDKDFWSRIGAPAHGRLLIRNKVHLVDLNTGRSTPIPKVLRGLTFKDHESSGVDLTTGESLIPLRDFPGLYYAASSVPLLEKKTSLILTLAVLCAAVFSLTLLVSFLIGRRMSEPLENMADQAMEIARKPSDSFLRKEQIRYVEFRKLAKAFNQVLLSLLEAQKQLEKTAKKKIDATEERYRLTVETAPDAITISRVGDGRYLQVNETFCRLSSYSREEALGRSPIDLKMYVNPSDRDRLVKTLKEKGEVNGMEFQIRNKDGTISDVLFSARPIRFDDEDCLIAVVSDISQRKRAEWEKARLERKLTHAQKMEAIGTLAGGVAHDLNNILSGIVSYPELLLLDLPEDSRLRKPILTIKESGQKAAAIVQDLLTLARRGVEITEVVNLNHIISKYLKSPEHERLEMFYPAVWLETELEKDLFNIKGSPVHLSKCVMNLVSNAAEAMPEGGKIFIKTENRYIDMAIRGNEDVEEGDYTVLCISDTGIGIKPDDLPRIFEPFYTKKVMGRSGTGLGMAVVWGTIKDHKGYIDIRSTEGEGTSITLYFPITREESAKKKSLLNIGEYMGKGESILIVDDVKEQREIASGILKRLGYSVTSIPSGGEAIEYLKENSVDLIVLDMIMDPGIDGLETYKRILELHPGQKAIIASGFSETDRVREAQSLGAGPYIKKPYALEKIGPAIKEELEK